MGVGGGGGPLHSLTVIGIQFTLRIHLILKRFFEIDSKIDIHVCVSYTEKISR